MIQIWWLKIDELRKRFTVGSVKLIAKVERMEQKFDFKSRLESTSVSCPKASSTMTSSAMTSDVERSPFFKGNPPDGLDFGPGNFPVTSR